MRHIHARPLDVGGVLRDALLSTQSAASLRAVLAPKLSASVAVIAACQLHPVRQLVLFSSVAALLGNAGQANYAAANATLDALARQWQQAGGHATSMQWGPWAGDGMVSASVAARLVAQGMGLIPPWDGIGLLQAIMGHAATSHVVSAPLAVLSWHRMLRPVQKRSSFFAHVLATSAAPTASSGSAAVRAVAPLVPAYTRVLASVQELAIGVLGLPVDASTAFMAAGLDSLGARQAAIDGTWDG